MPVGAIIGCMATQRITSEKVVWTNIVDPTLQDVAALRRVFARNQQEEP